MAIIESVEDVDKLSQMLLYNSINLSQEIVLGIDCEGIAHGWPMALLQLYYNDQTYLIDLVTEKSLLYYLKEVFESPYIIKIFHDYLGDCASIVQNYGIECQGVFDTQTARRLYSEILPEKKICYSIGLGSLMEEFLDTKHTNKKEIHEKMKNDPYFWYQRPLSQEMVEYAVQDVNLLPELYFYFRELFQNLEAEFQYEQNALAKKVIEEALVCNQLAFMNRDKELTLLKPGDILKGIVRNITKNVIFIGLNIGVPG